MTTAWIECCEGHGSLFLDGWFCLPKCPAFLSSPSLTLISYSLEIQDASLPKRKRMCFIDYREQWNGLSLRNGLLPEPLGKQAIPGCQVMMLWIWTSWLWAKHINQKFLPGSCVSFLHDATSRPPSVPQSVIKLSLWSPVWVFTLFLTCAPHASLTLFLPNCVPYSLQKKPRWMGLTSGFLLLLFPLSEILSPPSVHPMFHPANSQIFFTTQPKGTWKVHLWIWVELQALNWFLLW